MLKTPSSVNKDDRLILDKKELTVFDLDFLNYLCRKNELQYFNYLPRFIDTEV